MDSKTKTLLETINIDQSEMGIFNKFVVTKILVDEVNKTWHLEIHNDTILPVEVLKEFLTKLNTSFSMLNDITVNITVDNVAHDLIKEYYPYLLSLVEPILPVSNIFLDNLKKNDDDYFIEVYNKAELRQVNEIIGDINDYLLSFGFTNKLTVLLNEEVRTDIQEAITNDLVNVKRPVSVNKEESITNESDGKPKFKRQPKENDPNAVLGRMIKEEPMKIKNIVGEDNNIIVEAYVFGTDYFESSKSNFKIITLKITDYSDSIYCKVFVRDDDEYSSLKKQLKEGSWFKIRGYTKNDVFSKELVLNARDINVIEKKEEDIKDEAIEKRIELHAHTMNSQMDGVVDAVLLVKQAQKWGHKAIAITDHNCVQSFPAVYNFVRGLNKGLKEGEEPFKAIYGTELTLIDDTVNIVLRENDSNLLDNTYVVFDFETTGFNAGGKDSIIEIGAVKLHNGEIVEKYDELINPGKPLSARITEVTSITDAMLADKDNEENAIKRFVKWIGDLPMVAHNAKFDVSFLEMAYKKYNLGTFTNPVIDTLELSRTLDSTFGRHSLSALVKRYEVPFDEESHHRGDYDAEATALVYHKMMKKLESRNFEKLSDLKKLVSTDEIHKFGRSHHVNLLAQNKVGLKNLFKIISLANTKYLYKTPRILRSEIERLREGILVGSGCYESEVFTEAKSKSDEELTNVINFYDYVEVQPLDCYSHMVETGDFGSLSELKEHIKKIIRTTKDAGKIIVATGDVHHLKKDDKIYREIIINQKVPGGGRHPLARNHITQIPNNHFRTTNEMLNDFSFIDQELAHELVIDNPKKIADMIDIIEVIIDTGGIPFSPRVKSDDGKSYLDCPRVVTDLVYDKASSWYGEKLPYNIEGRIATELYGDIVYKCCLENTKKEHPDSSDEEIEKETYLKVHKIILEGFDKVKEMLTAYIKETWTEEDGELNDKAVLEKLKKNLGGIIGGGFDPIYLIAQRLVKHSNDDGYLVGSRGSVGSSFVATMMGITEVNPLPAHYRCLKCKTSIFKDESGNELGATYSSGFDLPDKVCPNCGELMYKDGQDMPFATFLGFNADKVPDIDLNFSDLNQASAHEYTKVLFGVDNVYRAGTIGTVAEKTAFGYVKGYLEEKGIENMRIAEIERLALGCTGVKRTTGQHPGGIVVVPDYMDVFDFTPFQYPADDPNSTWRTTHFDYHAIDQDLLKLDILGHSDPTQLRMIQDLTGTDVLKVPLDDKDTMSIFTTTKALGVTNEQIMCDTGTLGIPEFGTPFTVSMVAETKPTTFAELIKISGLSHGTDVWLGNAQDLIKNNVVPFKEVIGCRDDIMVYLMYKGVKPIKAFKIMEFVRKGRASKDPETWASHKQTMIESGIEEWFIDSCQKIKYMFPKAHAAAYVISAFRIAWYKVHMPVYFYASWLTSKATDVDVETMIKGYDAIKTKIIDIQNKGYEATNKELGQLESLKICLEATARGINFLPVDLANSNATVWGVFDDKNICPPLSSIDGLGITVANTIVEERSKGEFLSKEDLQKRGKVSKTLTDKMDSMGMLNGMPESNQLSLF